MKPQIDILKSKIALPKSSDTLLRTRFLQVFDEIPHHKIVLVKADAGYGKTTLISQAMEYLSFPTAWYRLDQSDMDVITFVSHIIASIQTITPEFGEPVLKAMQTSPITEFGWKKIIAKLINEIDKLPIDHLMLVLDDYHEVAKSDVISDIISFIIENTPDLLHLVLITRSDSTLRLSKYRSRREILDITRADLVFSVNEVELIFQYILGISLPPESVIRLHQKTEGWISGLILFYQSIRNKSLNEIDDLLATVSHMPDLFFEYMKENVYHFQTDEMKHFLTHTALLFQMEVDFCTRFLKNHQVREILETLEKKHLFTQCIEKKQQVYTYHNLFQTFLRRQLNREKGKAYIYEMHIRAAALSEDYAKLEDALHHYENALYHYIEAEQNDDIVRLIEHVGNKLLKQKSLKRLDQMLNRIPSIIAEKSAWCFYFRAWLYTTAGSLQLALTCNEKAMHLFSIRKLQVVAHQCFELSGLIHFLLGNFLKAEGIMLPLIKKITKNKTNGSDHYLQAKIWGYLILTSANLSKFEAAEDYYGKVMASIPEIEEPDERIEITAWINLCRGYQYLLSGNMEKAIEKGNMVKNEFEISGSSFILASCYHLLSIAYWHTGKIDKGMKLAQKGLKSVKEAGFQDLQEAWLRICTSKLYLSSGNLDQALEEADKGYKIFQKSGSDWGELNIRILYILIFYIQKKPTLMAPQFEACLAILNEYTHPYESGRLNGFMATYLVDQGDYKEAGIFLKKAEKLLAYSNFESNSLKFLRARLKLVGGEKEDAYSLVVSALNAWKKNSFDPWFLGIAPWMIQLLLIAYEENHLQDYIKNVFSTADHQPLKFLYDMQRELPENLQKQAGLIIQQIPRPKCAPLKVIGLGKFRVKVGDREIIPAEWKSKNAERLFKYLLLSHSKGYISNEILMELLWPEENPQITVKRLHVLLPTLRKMLEPDLKRGAPSAYIKRKGSGYQIVLGESGYFDVDQFIEEAGKVEKETASQKTLGHCLKAVSIYSGKLFPEEPYAEWCFDERERLQRLYLKLLQDIITIYEEMNLYSKCIEFAERYLDADLFCEEIYSRLMTYYAHINDTAKIRSTYERCIKYIVNELDCPISPETQEKYNTLLKVNSR